jgi:endonuclease/exonuclease/phosphatase family metal-dependent hydrolase
MSDDTVRITTWNCRSGSIASRLQDVGELNSDIVFLQECQPGPALPLHGDLLLQSVGDRKGLALAAPTGRVKLERIERADAPASSIAALATGPLECLLLGVWTHPPDYRAEIDQLTAAFGDLIAQMPTVLMGDLNTGPRLGESFIKGGEVFARLADIGLVSAYHAHHGVLHGQERHATHFHVPSGHSPWHIDYCMLSPALLPRLASVEVGGEERWGSRSDHRPLTVALAV